LLNNKANKSKYHEEFFFFSEPSFTTLRAFSCILMPSSLKFITTSYCVLPMVVSKDPPALYFCSVFSIILLSEKKRHDYHYDNHAFCSSICSCLQYLIPVSDVCPVPLTSLVLKQSFKIMLVVIKHFHLGKIHDGIR